MEYKIQDEKQIHRCRNQTNGDFRSAVIEVYSGEGDRQRGDDWAVARGVVIKFEERRRNQLVVPGNREECPVL